MTAHKLKTVFHYTVGRLYQLRDIQELVPKLKTISSRQAQGQIFHLYREVGTHNLWMEGPFKGEGTSGFMYLGPRKTKSQFRAFLMNEFKSFLQDVVTQAGEVFFSRGEYMGDGGFDLDQW